VDAHGASTLLGRAEAAWTEGDGEAAMAFFGRAAEVAEAADDDDTWVAAVLGLARGQQYNLTPGLLPVRLHAAYEATASPRSRARLAAALGRCWAYANEPTRAQPFAIEAVALTEGLDDPVLLADVLDAALVTHWGPDDLPLRRDWANRLADTAAHLPDPNARLQAHLWGLTAAWEVLDLPRMHHCMRAIELLADESPRAAFFAASRRLPLELLRHNFHHAPLLIERAEHAAAAAVIPDAEGVLHAMRGYAAVLAGDAAGCAAEAPAFEAYAVEHGVATVRAEAALIWLGAGRLDKVAEMVGVFSPEVLQALPRGSDWLLTLQCILEGVVAVGDAQLTAAVVALLAPYAGRSVVNAGAVMWHGVTDDTLAKGLALLGDADAAAEHRTAALATYQRIGAVWWRDRLQAWRPSNLPDTATPDILVHFHPQPGGLWLVGRAGRGVTLPAMRGFRHLHMLLSVPNASVPAYTLAGGGSSVQQSGIEVLDDQARRAYRARLVDLDAEMAEADEWADVGRSSRLADEREALLGQLASASGLSGRSRAQGSNDERARITVRKAIVAALARIAGTDPWLGRHLRDRVHTGFECRYEPDPDHPIRWVLQVKV
jgi:hypothetical protein